jgi:hypothetical protein
MLASRYYFPIFSNSKPSWGSTYKLAKYKVWLQYIMPKTTVTVVVVRKTIFNFNVAKVKLSQSYLVRMFTVVISLKGQTKSIVVLVFMFVFCPFVMGD